VITATFTIIYAQVAVYKTEVLFGRKIILKKGFVPFTTALLINILSTIAVHA
jgi:hypothetical protein